MGKSTAAAGKLFMLAKDSVSEDKKAELLTLAAHLFSSNGLQPLVLTVVGTAIASAIFMGVLVVPGVIAQVTKLGSSKTPAR
jgi:hypothetical protein